MLEPVLNEKLIYIEDEIKDSYIDYSMSVIVGRALPDVRDGLKPVHRRILFAMSELSNTYDKPHKKSARIVGEVLGKYHPHGDTAVYDAMVRMAQDFNFRYQLVDGHGNFGSIDGDSAAAMRYTEVRMSKIAVEMLDDIDKNTIDFRKNFDETLDEPIVLPSKIPNLLLNGSIGIAVGMATNIPPHNLGELVDGIVAYIDNREVTIDDLILLIKGPDFPTAGVIYGHGGIEEAYRTGRGKIKLRGKASIEEMKNGKEMIIISEIPYQVNKARMIEKIAELVKEKKIVGITDLRDESNREGIRVTIEVKKGESAELILNSIFKFTDMEVTFGVIMLALVDNVPRILNIKEMIVCFVEHRFEVVTRRTKFELDKAEKRAHILAGFKIALDNIDEVVSIIRGSRDVEDAKSRLGVRFGLSEEQSKAIVEMRLRTLTGLERDKIEEEYKNLIEFIKKLKEILADERKIYEIIKNESLEVKDKFNDKRRTEIVMEQKEISIEDLIKDEKVIVTITNSGYIKRIPLDKYREQKRGGKGASTQSMEEEDFIQDMYLASNHDTLVIFTSKGKVYNIKVYEIPETSKTARGKLISNIINISDEEKVKDIIRVKEFDKDLFVFFLTAKGVVKRTSLDKFKNINKAGIRAVTLNEGDDLIFVGLTNGTNEIIIATRKGMSIRFNENDVRDMGRNAAGVKGINLRYGDDVISGVIVSDDNNYLLTVNENGHGKMTIIGGYRLQTRGGTGTINTKPNEKTGDVVKVLEVKPTEQVMIITSKGIVIRTPLNEVTPTGRGTHGVILMKTGDNGKVVAVAKICEEDIEVDSVEDEEQNN